MISSLTGRVTQITAGSLVIDVSGFGMLVYAPARTLAELTPGEQATVLTSMIVREDSMTLYGFSNSAEREVFDMMLSVSGIGPRIALAVLGVYTAAEVEKAVAGGDDKAFTKVPGIGPKGARRIVLELAGKLIVTDEQSDQPAPSSTTGPDWKPRVLEALIGLGWSEKDSLAVIESYLRTDPEAETHSVASALKAILAGLGSQHSTVRH